MRHRFHTRRLTAILAVMVLTGVGATLGVRALHERREPSSRPSLYASTIALPELRDRDAIERARGQLQFRVLVNDGSCSGATHTPEQRFDRIGVRESPRAVTAWARMREEELDGACAGVGLDFRATWVLSNPVGHRALILASLPNDPDRIVIPPTDRTDARDLVLAGRAAGAQPQRMFVGAACDLVARHLRDVPRRVWCAS